MKYLIGVDAGGSTVEAEAYTLDGELLSSAYGDSANLTVSFQCGLNNIRGAIDELIAAYKDDECVFICIGCAGAETGKIRERAANILRAFYGNKIHITNDAYLGIYSALEGRDGMLLISGTGSIGYLRKNGSFMRCGGWGHLIDDRGSGYSIVIEAFRRITEAHDHEIYDTPLTEEIFGALKISKIAELIDFTYRAKKNEISALLPVVEKTAEDGDKEARLILESAGEQLAELLITLYRMNDIPAPTIAISGSVIKKTRIVKQKFIERLDSEIVNYTLIDRDFYPSKAVYYFYKEHLNAAPDEIK